MNLEVYLFFQSLCVAVLCGIILPLVYDVVKSVFCTRNKIVIFILDCFFVLSFAIVFILILYYACDGKIRGVFFIALVIGFVIYIKVLQNSIRKLLYYLIFPFRKIFSLALKYCKKIYKFFVEAIAKKRSKLYNGSVK